MKTKLQLSKNVTMNKPNEKRQGMKVRREATHGNINVVTTVKTEPVAQVA